MDYLLCVMTGLLTFISPCVLPMLPVYISYFSAGDSSRKKTFINSLGFSLGMTIVLTLLGLVAAGVGVMMQSYINEYKWVVNVVAGLIVIILGLSFIEVIRIPFLSSSREIKVKTADMTFISALIFGLVYAISFGPCALAFGSFSLLYAIEVAIATGNIFSAIMFQLIFAGTLSILFIISAMLIDWLKGIFGFIKRHYKIINIISGGLLILLGILMMTGVMEKISALMA